MATITTAPITLDEFARLARGTEQHELSAGELKTLPPPKALHALIASLLFEVLQNYLRKQGEARAFAEAGYILSRDPLTIRQPDVSVLSKARIKSADPDGYFEGAPELAVEIVSPSDSAEDLQVKVDQYLQSGARQVWILYPKTKCIYVFRAGEQVAVLDASQRLEGGDLLPGFSVAVADLFLSENHANA